MEQPPILGRPKPDQPAPGPPEPEPKPVLAEHQRSVRGAALITAGVAVVVLAACNGLLLWLYQHSSLGVVITLGTFVAGVSLAWLRNRSRQLTAIVLYVQALMVVSVVAGVLVGLTAGVVTGVLAGGITLAGLLLLSLIGLLHFTGERKPFATTVSLGTAVAVVATMIGAYGFLSWDYYTTTYRAPYVKPPQRIVYYLIDKGQYYTENGSSGATGVEQTFQDYTCEEAREQISAIFTELVDEGNQHLSSPENLKVTGQGTADGKEIATVTASVSVVDDLDGSVIAGPEIWTFHLEKGPGDVYWRVCRIDRPS
ncbi:MAG TPA: hypothetical protein VFZ32_12605 [Micromonosporaceae bacterium]